MAYEDPDKFISDSTLFFLPGAMILWLLIFMIVTLSYSVNSPPKIMPRAVNLGLVGVASVFMGLWLLGLMVCYCRGTFLKGRSGRDVAPKAPGWGEDMEKRMCKLEEQTKPPTPLPGQAQRAHQNAQIKQRDERLLSQSQPFQERPMQQPTHPQSFQPLYSQGIPTQPQPLGQQQPLPQQQPHPYPVQPEPVRHYKAFQPQAQQQTQQQAYQDGVRRHQSRPMPDGPRDMPPSQHRSRNRQPSPGRANRYPPLTSGYNSSIQNTPITMYHPPRSSSQPSRVRSTVQEVSESPGSPPRGRVSRRQGSDNLRRSRSSPPPGEALQSGRHWEPAQDHHRPFAQNDASLLASPDSATRIAMTVSCFHLG